MCFPCRGEKGVDCYTLWCGECGEEVAAYKGKTGRTSYSRGLDYLETLENRNEDKLVLWLHSVHHHQGRVRDEYSMRVGGGGMCKNREEKKNIVVGLAKKRKNVSVLLSAAVKIVSVSRMQDFLRRNTNMKIIWFSEITKY